MKVQWQVMLHRCAIPVRLESFWAGVYFVQHDCIRLFLWHQDFKLECSGLGGERPFPMSFENGQAFACREQS